MPELRTVSHQRSHVPKLPPEQGEAHGLHYTYPCSMHASQLPRGWLICTSSTLPAAQACHISIGAHALGSYVLLPWSVA